MIIAAVGAIATGCNRRPLPMPSAAAAAMLAQRSTQEEEEVVAHARAKALRSIRARHTCDAARRRLLARFDAELWGDDEVRCGTVRHSAAQ